MEYYKKTSPLIGYYYAKGQLRGVDGMGEIDDVAAEIARGPGGMAGPSPTRSTGDGAFCSNARRLRVPFR
jgi:hypothetical protein